MTRDEFPLSKALETLKDETIAVIGYGVQGPGQSLNLKDNGFNVIVGQRKNSKSWDKAVADGWVPGETLSISKRPPQKPLSYSTFCPMQARYPCGRLSRNTSRLARRFISRTVSVSRTRNARVSFRLPMSM